MYKIIKNKKHVKLLFILYSKIVVLEVLVLYHLFPEKQQIFYGDNMNTRRDSVARPDLREKQYRRAGYWLSHLQAISTRFYVAGRGLSY